MRKYLSRAVCAIAAAGLMVGTLSACTVKVQAGGAKKPAPAKKADAPAPAPAPKKKFNAGAIKFKVSPDGRIELPGPVLFETGTAKLKPESDAVLEVVDKYLKAKAEITKLRIEGHTDTDGEDAKNLQLSKDRAMSVSAWLASKGNDCKRLVPVGFGEKKLLVNPEATPDDKARNRRVVFINAEVKGNAVGGLPVDGGGEMAGDPCAL